VQANVLLAEICSVACSNSKKAEDRDLWTRRVIQTEKCLLSADAAIERGVPCSVRDGSSTLNVCSGSSVSRIILWRDVQHENTLRLLKAKFLLQQQLKAERAAKNRRLLEILCEGLKSCTATGGPEAEVVTEFRNYFGVKLKACLVKMHAATVLAKHAKSRGGANTFADNLKYLRETLPNYIDKSFLVRLSCGSGSSESQY
jgi:hypothetical protein